MPDRPLHILHLTAGSDAGGLSRYIFDLGSAMVLQGHRITIAGERGAWHWLFEGAPFEWIDVPLKGNVMALRRATTTLRQFMSAHRVDILHTHYRRPTLVARRLQTGGGSLLNRIIPTRTIVSSGGWKFPPILYTLHLSHLSLSWWRRPFSDFGDHTHVASEEARRWLIDDARVDPRRITLIPHGIDPSRFPHATPQDRAAARAALGIAPGDRVAAYVGRLDVPKNEDWLPLVAQAWGNRSPRLRILLAGEGPHEAALRRQIESLGLADRVTLLGHRDPLPVYQAADLLLLPSSREGFSLVTAEAMSVGTPVLRTATSGAAGLIIENITGRSTPIDRDAFVATAVELLGNPRRLIEMGNTAARHVREHFSFDQQTTRTIALYRGLLPHTGGMMG